MGPVAVRTATREDVWRRFERDVSRPLAVTAIEYEELPGFAAATVEFGKPITAICGANGAGKTALLTAVWLALDPGAARTKANLLRLGNARIATSVLCDGVMRKYSIDVGNLEDTSEPNAPTTYIDSAPASMEIQHIFSQKEDIDAVLNGIDPIELNRDDIKSLSFMVGKDYQSVEIFEIEEANVIIPFVRVTAQNLQYDCRTMGLGELCVIYIFWKLLVAESKFVCLIEEPETFVSPAAQRALADLIAATSTSKRLWVIITTHSPTVIERLPQESIRFLYHLNGQSQVLPQASREAALKRLGLRPAAATIIAVEDRVSREFFRLWAGEHDIELLGRVELIDVGGASNITAARKSFPKSKFIRLIGVYDGDQQETIIRKADETPFCFLPGSDSVEAMLRDVANQYVEQVAKMVGRPQELVAVSLSELAGIDDHDWLLDFSERVGLTLEQMLQGLFRCWFALEENSSKSEQAFLLLSNLELCP